ncbi:MAG: Hpt domain-containing protein [Planktothrix sp. GU0601_MAG3]|nr:MAG: Hpt domain-containing protein [Planktothrix sp. GU0601_MAG3]
MQLEQQQRIMGYFIEEAKDHLNTIEQGLLNLQTTIEDPELLNEVFRAAHSVKGGAAMLGLNSIQQTAHRLEDSFKILKENRLPNQFIDQQLESLFLQVFDTLQALIDQLSGPYGLTEEAASAILQDVEPVFEALNYHIKVVQQQGTKRVPEMETGATSSVPNRPIPTPVISKEPPSSAKDLVFRSDVPERLREMLQQFKQSETPQTRQGLIETCRSLSRVGELFDLPNWVRFIETLEKVIANPDNHYRILAPIVIKSIKEAQELVLVNREEEIVVTEGITKLLPKTVSPPKTDKKTKSSSPSVSASQTPPSQSKPPKTTTDTATKTGQSKQGNGKKNPPKVATPNNAFSDVNWSDSVTNPSNTAARLQNGPEITPDEYNSLRDLFEGLDQWEQEVTEEAPTSTSPSLDIATESMSGDFFDLLEDEKPEFNQRSTSGYPPQTQKGKTKQKPGLVTSGTDDDLLSFFDHLSDGDSAISETVTPTKPTSVGTRQHYPVEGFGDLFDELLAINPQEGIPSPGSADLSPTQITELLEDAENLDDLFDQFDPKIQASQETDSSTSGQMNVQEDWFEELLQGETRRSHGCDRGGAKSHSTPPDVPKIRTCSDGAAHPRTAGR